MVTHWSSPRGSEEVEDDVVVPVMPSMKNGRRRCGGVTTIATSSSPVHGARPLRSIGACRDFTMRGKGPRGCSMETRMGGVAALLSGQGDVAGGDGSSMEACFRG
jgi:hypothetical protein